MIDSRKAPIRPDRDTSLHPFPFPDGPLRRDVICHVEWVRQLSGGYQGVFPTGIRAILGGSRFRNVDTLAGHAPKKRRRKPPALAPD